MFAWLGDRAIEENEWRLIQVTFDDGNATIELDVSVKGQGEGIPAKQPVKAGYSFGGWFTRNDTSDDNWGEEFTAANETDLSSYFKSDIDRYVVTYSDGVVKLAAPSLSLTSKALVTANAPQGATVFVAAYSGAKLLGLYRATAINGTTNVSSMGLSLTGADRLAAFMLNESLRPLCSATEISLSESE